MSSKPPKMAVKNSMCRESALLIRSFLLHSQVQSRRLFQQPQAFTYIILLAPFLGQSGGSNEWWAGESPTLASATTLRHCLHPTKNLRPLESLVLHISRIAV